MGLSHFRERCYNNLLSQMHSQRFLLVWKEGLSPELLSFSMLSSSAPVWPVERGVCLHSLGLHGPVVALVLAVPANGDIISGPAEGAEQRSRCPGSEDATL